MVPRYNRIKMKNYNKEKGYRIVRMKFTGFSIAIPYRAEDGGIGCRTIPFEMIEYGGKEYRCAKDHRDKVIYIDIQATGDANEGGG